MTDLSALALSTQEIIIRLAIALAIGAFIGTEREFSHRPAGLRTHMLVSLGACVVMITGQLLYCQYGANTDPARLSAQVIAGVGFLGAGTILREGAIVKGLTTAASIWAVACLGIAVGAGFYTVSLTAAGFIFLTLTVFEWLQHRVFRNRFGRYSICLKCTNVVPTLEKVNQLINSKDARLSSIQVEDVGDGLCEILLYADFAGRHCQERHQAFLVALQNADQVVSIKSEKI